MPYGLERYESGSLNTAYRFTGQRIEDNTDLYYYGSRWYDPAVGRFIQADTIVPEPANLGSLNRYSYVLNNPLRYTDPSGHWVFEQTPKDQFYIPFYQSPNGQAMRVAADPCFGACEGNPLWKDGTIAIGPAVAGGFMSGGVTASAQLAADSHGQVAVIATTGYGADLTVGEASISLRTASVTDADFVQDLAGPGVLVGGGIQALGTLQLNWMPSKSSEGSTINGWALDIGGGLKLEEVVLPMNFHVYKTDTYVLWIFDLWKLLGFERPPADVWPGGADEATQQ